MGVYREGGEELGGDGEGGERILGGSGSAGDSEAGLAQKRHGIFHQRAEEKKRVVRSRLKPEMFGWEGIDGDLVNI